MRRMTGKHKTGAREGRPYGKGKVVSEVKGGLLRRRDSSRDSELHVVQEEGMGPRMRGDKLRCL